MREIVLVLAVFTTQGPSCSSAPETTDKGPETATPPPRTDGKTDAGGKTDPNTRPDPCAAAALGLTGSAPLAPWTIPSGCTPRGAAGEHIARSEAALAERLECTGTTPGIDFTKTAILSVGYTLSPAGAGLGAFDDGKVVTLVSRQRNPCPGDPMPMPMNTMAWFSLPADGERSFANTTCVVDSKCP